MDPLSELLQGSQPAETRQREQREDNKEASISSRAQLTSSLMLPVKWRVGDVCCLTYSTQSHIHHKHDDSFLSCHSSLYGVTEYDQQRTRDIGVTK